jgi:hypothetical protein
MRRVVIAISVLIFGFTCGAFAQHAGAPAMPPAQGARIAPMVMPAGTRPNAPLVAAVPARPVAHAAPGVHPVSKTTVHGTALQASLAVTKARTLSNGSPRRNFNNFVDEFGAPFASDQLNVPGLGFDYVHFAAVHPNEARHHFNTGFSTPFLGGGIYVPVPYYYSEQAAAAPNAAENPAAEASEATDESENVDTRATASVAPRNSPRLEPSSEYVFVRRDGTVFFAVAFSFSAGNLQYVTKEGLRRSVPANTLDLDATQQFNEQRGVTVRLPA